MGDVDRFWFARTGDEKPFDYKLIDLSWYAPFVITNKDGNKVEFVYQAYQDAEISKPRKPETFASLKLNQVEGSELEVGPARVIDFGERHLSEYWLSPRDPGPKFVYLPSS